MLLAAAALIVLTCAYTWPLAMNPRSSVPHDRGDPLLVTWILWCSTRTLPLTEHWWNAPAFFPATGVLAFSENLLGLAPISAPIIALTHAPLLAYNTALLLSYVLSGLAAYFLGYVLTSRRDAACVAALAYAFAPYRLSHVNHLQLLSAYWIPVAIAALHLYVRQPRWRTAALFSAAWLMQSLTSGYYLFFLSLLVLLWLAWFAPRRLQRRHVLVLASWWLAVACVIAPLLAGYRAIHERYGFKRSLVEMEHYSADVAGVFSASTDSMLWGWLHAVDGQESELFPGVTIIVLAASGVLLIARRRLSPSEEESPAWRSALIFFLGTAMLMWLLTLGPHPTYQGRRVGIPGPYVLLMWLPGFDTMRVPARLWMLCILCLTAAAALVVSQIPRTSLRRGLAAVAVAGLLLDGWPRSFAVVPAPVLRPARPGDAVARLDLPLRSNETEAMYQTIGDGLPVFNGYSGYEAPQHASLRDLLERKDPAILDLLTDRGSIDIVVNRDLDSDGSWRTYVERAGARLVDTGSDWNRYELPQRVAVREATPSGDDLRIARVDANVNPADISAIVDSDLITRWHSAEQRGRETVTVDLGRARHVKWILLCLGTYASQYPRSLAVDTSVDGLEWSHVWSGRTALLTYKAAVADPGVIPIAIRVDQDARMLRLRQTADEPTRGWTIVELRVLG